MEELTMPVLSHYEEVANAQENTQLMHIIGSLIREKIELSKQV